MRTHDVTGFRNHRAATWAEAEEDVEGCGGRRIRPWHDPKLGIVFVKKHIILGDDGVRVERNVIGSRLREVLAHFGSVSVPSDGQTLEPGTLAAMANGGTASESQPQYQSEAVSFENFVELMLPPTHREKIRLHEVKAALEAGNTSYRVTTPTDVDAFQAVLDVHDHVVGEGVLRRPGIRRRARPGTRRGLFEGEKDDCCDEAHRIGVDGQDQPR
jgi:hypothetical protein